MHCLVIVPTYNERENLARLVERILAQGSTFDVLVVDDNSPDGTGRLADDLASRSAAVHVLHRSGRLGLGTAYVAGMRWGLARAYDVLFEMDADFSHDPAYLPGFVSELELGADVVIGSRNIDGGGVRNWSLLRTLVSRGGSAYASAILGLGVADATSGFKGFRRHVLEALNLEAVQSNGYGFQIELNYRCQLLGFRIREKPIVFVDRAEGRSKMNAGIAIEAIGLVWKLRLEQLFNPGHRPWCAPVSS